MKNLTKFDLSATLEVLHASVNIQRMVSSLIFNVVLPQRVKYVNSKIIGLVDNFAIRSRFIQLYIKL